MKIKKTFCLALAFTLPKVNAEPLSKNEPDGKTFSMNFSKQ